MNNCIIYARYSPRPQQSESSIELQVEECAAYAAKQGWEVSSIVEDPMASGGEERPLLYKAINLVGRGDILLVHKLDRLARDVYLSEAFHRQVRARGGRVCSVMNGECDESPSGRMIRQILDVANEYERRVIAQRTSQSMRKQQDDGKRMSRFPVYGWMSDPADPTGKSLIPCDPERAAIEDIVSMRNAGMGWKAIANECEVNQFPRRGQRWYASTVRKIYQRHATDPPPVPSHPT